MYQRLVVAARDVVTCSRDASIAPVRQMSLYIQAPVAEGVSLFTETRKKTVATQLCHLLLPLVRRLRAYLKKQALLLSGTAKGPFCLLGS